MGRRTRHLLAYASVIALALLELSSVQRGEVVKNPRGEMSASIEIGAGPLLTRPRVSPPPAAHISVPAVRVPGLLTVGHVGHFPLAIADLSLQKEHIRLQI
ncbi:MAG TPA: hypothetical protein VHC22_03130 [Pirellulales bacterium]|nr:hypothetical protein [Pirellulales bacterium]